MVRAFENEKTSWPKAQEVMASGIRSPLGKKKLDLTERSHIDHGRAMLSTRQATSVPGGRVDVGNLGGDIGEQFIDFKRHSEEKALAVLAVEAFEDPTLMLTLDPLGA